MDPVPCQYWRCAWGCAAQVRPDGFRVLQLIYVEGVMMTQCIQSMCESYTWRGFAGFSYYAARYLVLQHQ